MSYLTPSSVVDIEATADGFDALLVVDPGDPDAFSYPSKADPHAAFWVKRVPIRCEVIP